MAKRALNKRRSIHRLLIANRGEIACRIVSTARALGIVCIVIFTEEDRDSLHVQSSPEAVCLGHVTQAGGDPYQNIERLVQTARDVHADAVHPGYGYLSESAAFAKAVSDAGFIFVGPSPDSISALGDKRQAKEYLAEHAPEIPLIPGYNGVTQDGATLRREAEDIGFPVLIKAAAGGGGRGMRVVDRSEDFAEEIERAQSEAQQSFGSRSCILEKYIEQGKHIEIQIIGDSNGDILSLYDRECSVQRRHQKIIEEAPSAWLAIEVRSRMIEAAKTIARLMRYENAGTVEFIVDIKTGAFYFLEVNTRIQVEHPITEAVTGVDVVALQLYVASGGLWRDHPTVRKETIAISGHAIECRLCAEDPAQGFLPDSGLILRWTPGSEFLQPREQMGVRFETALQTGGRVSIHFDSMIAKVIVWAPTREEAISKMILVLRHTICIGIRTNQHFLQRCLLHKAFIEGSYSTSFISDHLQDLLATEIFNSGELARTLSLAPAILSRFVSSKTESAGTRYRPFGSIRPSFRNQVYDQSNRLTDVVSVQQPAASQGDTELYFYILWLSKEDGGVHWYNIEPFSPVTTSPIEEKSPPSTESPSAPLLRHFNHTFAGIREHPSETVQAHKVYVSHSSIHTESEKNPGTGTSSRLEWKTADITIEVDDRRFSFELATDPVPTNAPASTLLSVVPPRRVYCHLPSLGTNILLQHYSVLSFGESRRKFFTDNASDALAADPTRTYKAHMPCKILKVLKKNGDTVKAGEILLVVESMKMEIKILALANGTFETSLAEGDAVKEDVMFCQVLDSKS